MIGSIALDAALAFITLWLVWRIFAAAIRRKKARPETRLPLRSYPSAVVGLRYPAPDGTNRSSYARRRLRQGDLIQLVRDPDNEHDDNAVACFHGKVHLGFIPSRHDWVARSLDEGDELQAVITDFDQEGSQITAIKIDVGILRDGNPKIGRPYIT